VIKSIFNPDLYVKSLEQIDLDYLYVKGIRMILIDVDNTLAKHGSFEADDYSRRQIARVLESKIKCLLFSNALPARIKSFAESINAEYVDSPRKPSRRGIRRTLELFPNIDKSMIAVVGDQIFTDVLSGNRAGIMTILVDPISEDEAGQVKIKRGLERFLKRRLKLKLKT
jgi:HAD superfamily phosphatase (TIGR01668 family)